MTVLNNKQDRFFPYDDLVMCTELPVLKIIKDRNNVIRKDDIELVNFNDKKGVTVVKWKDGSISKVKVQTDKGDVYNPELGLAMCIVKKAMGNKGNFNDVFKKWMPEE